MNNREKGIIYHKWGGSEELEYSELPEEIAINPDSVKLKSNELLIKVKAISINPIDWKILSGSQKMIATGLFPRILGADFSGEIYKMGSPVNKYGLKINDPVLGMVSPLNNGSGRQWLKVKASHCIKIPDFLNFEEAASLSAAGISAIKALSFIKSKTPGKVLIIGAGGGVGSLALQILSHKKWEITAVARNEQHDILRRLGCKEFIEKQKWIDTLEENNIKSSSWDAIIDGPGSLIKKRPAILLKKKGFYSPVYIPDSFIAGHLLRCFFWLFRSYSTGIFLAYPSRNRMKNLEKLINSGIIKPVIHSVWEKEDCEKAVQKSCLGGFTGKIIIKMN